MSRKISSGSAPTTAGVAELKMDLFGDVKRALHAHLMRTDTIYSKASRDATLRNQRIKERAGFGGVDEDEN
jgi:hypothetical protein